MAAERVMEVPSPRSPRRWRGLLLTAIWALVPAASADELDDALATRIVAADYALATRCAVTFYNRPPATGGEPTLSVDNACATFSLRLGNELRVSRWRLSPAPARMFHHSIRFIWQNQTECRETVIETSPMPSSVVSVSPPAAANLGFLWDLGVCANGLVDPRELLDATRTTAPGQPLRGVDTVLVRDATHALWLAPSRDYAPVRLVTRTEGGIDHVFVEDWWGYRTGGELPLPRFYLARGFSRSPEGVEYCRVMTFTAIHEALVGMDAVRRQTPPDWEVPLLAGAFVNNVALGTAGNLGLSPAVALAVAEADGQPWGISLRALAADVELELPDTPEDLAAVGP